MSLYACVPIPNGGFALTKFDNDLNPEVTYAVTNATCTCPAGARPTCKHRSRLLPAFMKRSHIADGWFLNDENMMWHRPINDAMADVEVVTTQAMDKIEEAAAQRAAVPTDFKRRV